MENIDSKLTALIRWLGTDANARGGAFISPKIGVKDVLHSGRGIYANTPIAALESLVRIPLSYLLNFTTAVAHITKCNPQISLTDSCYHQVHVPATPSDAISDLYALWDLDTLLGLSSFQLLAMFLVLERKRNISSFWKPFIDMLPAIDELALAPIVWRVLLVPECDTLWRMLPRSARKHSDAVLARFEKDYETVSKLVCHNDRPSFLWAWMCINSRCLYMEIPQAKDSADNFTMAPYVDFLNHLVEDQCGIKIDGQGFHVLTSGSYNPNEELYFSYGPHSNEFLLCEYGFTLPENKWNFIDISDYIQPLFRPNHVAFLKDLGYYGDYTVNAEGMSFRTEIALATLQDSDPNLSRKLKALVGGLSDGAAFEPKLKSMLRRILDKISADSRRKLEASEVYDQATMQKVRAIKVLHQNIIDIAQKAVI